MNCNDKNSNFVSAYSFPIFMGISQIVKLNCFIQMKNMRHEFRSSQKAVKNQKSIFRKAVILITPKVFIYLDKRRHIIKYLFEKVQQKDG